MFLKYDTKIKIKKGSVPTLDLKQELRIFYFVMLPPVILPPVALAPVALPPALILP